MCSRQCCFLFNAAGNGISVEGALLTEQDVNHPKPAKRARTSFTADQLQVQAVLKTCLVRFMQDVGAGLVGNWMNMGGGESMCALNSFINYQDAACFWNCLLASAV